MKSLYRVVKGVGRVYELLEIPGISDVRINPSGAGEECTVELTHERNAGRIPTVVKDQTIGNIILEGPIE